MPGITDIEGRTQFSLWCLLGAPLFLGTDVRNMTAYTHATVGNLEAIAINQESSVQGWQIDLSGGNIPAPIPDNGGLLLNLTSCSGTNTGLSWSFDDTSGQLSNAASTTQCVTILSCDLENQTEVFAYQCVSNSCHNEVWKFSGSTIVSQIVGASEPLCLTGLDPSTGPYSQVISDVCDGRPGQQWEFDTTTKQLRLPSWPESSQCLTLFSAPLVDAYMKTMNNGDIALALLNRGDTDVGPQTIDLTIFGYAPGQQVNVRDVWTASSSGPYMGSFTTARGVQSHETLLLRLSNAVVAEL
jgi:hypothetical protein